jgi:alkylation response protein AidB-like acyl-CoA dehydrogenase
MKLKNELCFEGDAVMAKVEKVKNVPVAWAMARNREKLEKPLADVRKMLESTAAMKALNEAIQKAAEAHAEKNADGKPKTEIADDRVMMRLADTAGYTAAVEALRASEDHVQALVDEKELKDKETALLAETIDWEPYKLKVERLKDGDMDGAQMRVLFKMGILEE